MRQFYLQRQFYHLAKKRIIQPTKDDQERMRLLNIWVAMRRKGIKSKEVIEAIGYHGRHYIAGRGEWRKTDGKG